MTFDELMKLIERYASARCTAHTSSGYSILAVDDAELRLAKAHNDLLTALRGLVAERAEAVAAREEVCNRHIELKELD
jgi:hypothetical protein